MPVLRRYLPIAAWLPAYHRGAPAGDAVAGLSVWALLVPQCLAYAVLAGVPVQYGLYTAFAALVTYPLFGTSRQLVQGPSAAVCAVSAAVVTPLVGGFATDGSLSKTSVADAAGQTSQVASVVNAALILLTMLFLAGLFESLPGATLAAVVVDAMLGLITFVEWRRYYGVNRADWLFFTGAGLGILAFGIIQGILVGVVLSLLLLIWRSSRTSIRELRYDASAGVLRAASRHEGLAPLPGVLVLRVDGPLFFADADRFRDRVRELLGEHPGTRRLVVDAEAIHLTDTDGADTVADAAATLAERGIAVALVGLHPPVQALWDRAGVFAVVGRDATYDTIAEAVGGDRPASPIPGVNDVIA